MAIMKDDPLIRETLVKRLISRGADINARAIPRMQGKLLLKAGNTPLHMASIRKQHKIAKILLNHKAERRPQNDDMMTPYDYAKNNNDEKMMTILKEYRGEDKEKKKTKPEKKTPLTARKEEPRGIDERGRTQSFDEASVKDRRKEHDGLDELIKDPDANVNIRNANGLYPLHQAIMRNDPVERNQLVEALIRKGAEVNGRALKSGNTPLHLAVTRNQLGTTRLLLSYMPTLTVPNNAGKTPYAIAEDNGNMEILSLLESYKRNVVNKRRDQSVRDKQNCVIS
ncbi:poly [ADP-ribose] polymerase tankyrase-2-like [Saccostrea cucullata]|uniref:poly [ADP-ribose] polymerase tankyrase-2-like n=1 Tax=Saccostrea cuccullata TaxID=36930 RepID=UPI002ECFC49C